MDVSVYYERFQSSYNWAIAAVCLAVFAFIFCCVRTIMDKTEECRPIWRKIVYCVGYAFLFGFVVWLFFKGPYLMKKDIDQQSIYTYEGELEVVELIPGFHQKAVFLLDGEEVCLKYTDDDYIFEIIPPTKYSGKLIYSKHLTEVLYIEIDPIEGE